MVILLLGQAANLATGASAPLLVMGGGQRPWFFVTAIAFVLGFGLNLCLTPLYGMAGAATATTAAMGLMFISILLLVRSKFGFWPYDARYFKGLWAALSAGAVVWLVGLAPLSGDVILLVQFVIAFAVFGGGLLILGLDEEDRVFLNVLRKKIVSLWGLANGR
jgi:O-antigen/teichoic acid export membrane protein